LQALAPLMDALAKGARTTIARDAAHNYRHAPEKRMAEMSGQLRGLVEANATESDAAGVEAIAAEFTERWAAAFSGLDAVLALVWGRPAPLDAEISEIVTSPALFAEAVRYMVPFNYADLPLVVVPAAASRCESRDSRDSRGACPYSRRPRSFQLVGTSEASSEATLLKLAAAYESLRGDLKYPFDE